MTQVQKISQAEAEFTGRFMKLGAISFIVGYSAVLYLCATLLWLLLLAATRQGLSAISLAEVKHPVLYAGAIAYAALLWFRRKKPAPLVKA